MPHDSVIDAISVAHRVPDLQYMIPVHRYSARCVESKNGCNHVDEATMDMCGVYTLHCAVMNYTVYIYVIKDQRRNRTVIQRICNPVHYHYAT